jgi:hypothetical protein
VVGWGFTEPPLELVLPLLLPDRPPLLLPLFNPLPASGVTGFEVFELHWASVRGVNTATGASQASQVASLVITETSRRGI